VALRSRLRKNERAPQAEEWWWPGLASEPFSLRTSRLIGTTEVLVGLGKPHLLRILSAQLRCYLAYPVRPVLTSIFLGFRKRKVPAGASR